MKFEGMLFKNKLKSWIKCNKCNNSLNLVGCEMFITIN